VSLRVGEIAPDFDVTASDGRRLRLADFQGKKNVVLYFYPRDFTTVCTKEACGFRDMYEELVGKDTEVIGVSVDSDESHARFAAQHKVPFPLVADIHRDLARRYDAIGLIQNILGMVKRVTYVIDRRGRIAGAFHSELSAEKHLSAVRDTLVSLGP
jgi:peroxiredoxin Q/BCP